MCAGLTAWLPAVFSASSFHPLLRKSHDSLTRAEQPRLKTKYHCSAQGDGRRRPSGQFHMIDPSLERERRAQIMWLAYGPLVKSDDDGTFHLFMAHFGRFLFCPKRNYLTNLLPTYSVLSTTIVLSHVHTYFLGALQEIIGLPSSKRAVKSAPPRRRTPGSFRICLFRSGRVIHPQTESE